jgi:mono/diheme cytochrome c family protein
LPARCSRCHDTDGTGRAARDSLGEIPDFSNHKWQASRSDADLLVSILDGRGSHMPAYRGKLPEDEARALVASVRHFDPTPAAPAATGEFERRVRELEEELEELKRQFRDASAPPRRP